MPLPTVILSQKSALPLVERFFALWVPKEGFISGSQETGQRPGA